MGVYIRKEPSNIEASVRQRLLNLSIESGEDFNLFLTRFILERFLYRIGKSRYNDHLILKGAMLFSVWLGSSHRPTRDMDFLAYGDSSDKWLISVFQEICRQEVEPDGLLFDEKSVRLEEIREDQEYQGKRMLLIAHLGKAKNTVQIDIGFGDIITPGTQEVKYPTLLDFPAPKILIYPKETFIAEKFQAMVFFGMVNSRMKDYYDIWILSKRFTFQGNVLIRALQSTFNRRSTTIPKDIPTSLSNEFATDKSRRFMWNAFLKRNRLMETEVELLEIINDLRDFIMPLLSAITANTLFHHTWSPGGPWKQKGD